MKKLPLYGVCLLLLSCDAVNQIGYAVMNKRPEPVRLRVPDYSSGGGLDRVTDTVITLAPGELTFIMRSSMKIGFPGSAKKIYRESPGVCDLQLLSGDSVISLGCTRKEWKYRKRVSTLKIK